MMMQMAAEDACAGVLIDADDQAVIVCLAYHALHSSKY
jgi:hypothetical protein